MIEFPAPGDTFTMTGRGKVHVTQLTPDAAKAIIGNASVPLKDLKLIGETVLLGGKPFLVRGVETYALTRMTAPFNIGLMGDYITP